MAIDCDERFTLVESGMSGAHHDMSVFQYSDFGQKITHTDRLGNYFVLGDAGYVSMKYNTTLKHVTAILIYNRK